MSVSCPSLSPQRRVWLGLGLGSAFVTLPLLVLFMISSRQLIAGVAAGAVK